MSTSLAFFHCRVCQTEFEDHSDAWEDAQPICTHCRGQLEYREEGVVDGSAAEANAVLEGPLSVFNIHPKGDHWPSAIWEFKQIPGLRITKDKEFGGGKEWLAVGYSGTHEDYDEDEAAVIDSLAEQYHLGYRIWLQIKDQRFSTRREAMQAVEAVLLSEK